jgi:hypothetical protein
MPAPRHRGELGGRVKRFVALATAGSLLVATSCTKTVRVAESDYARISDASVVVLRIHTVDDRHYTATKFFATDTTLVITEARRSSGVTGERYGVDDPPRLPYELKWVQIESIDQVFDNETKTVIVICAVVVPIIALVVGFLNWAGGSFE